MILSVIILLAIIQNSLFCYIDPGTGSLLFSALFGIIGTLFFLSKALIIKLKTFSFSKNKTAETEASKKSKIIIYGEDKRYYNVFKPIIEELINLEIPIIYYSSSEDDPIFEIKNDLLFSGLSVKEIAYNLQFSAPNHLMRFFKRQTGTTVGEYIEEVKGKGLS